MWKIIGFAVCILRLSIFNVPSTLSAWNPELKFLLKLRLVKPSKVWVTLNKLINFNKPVALEILNEDSTESNFIAKETYIIPNISWKGLPSEFNFEAIEGTLAFLEKRKPNY